MEQAAGLVIAMVVRNRLDLGNLVVGFLELTDLSLVGIFDGFPSGLFARDSLGSGSDEVV